MLKSNPFPKIRRCIGGCKREHRGELERKFCFAHTTIRGTVFRCSSCKNITGGEIEHENDELNDIHYSASTWTEGDDGGPRCTNLCEQEHLINFICKFHSEEY